MKRRWRLVEPVQPGAVSGAVITSVLVLVMVVLICGGLTAAAAIV
jgi:hypothetical protein